MKEFLGKVGVFIGKTWVWFKSLPIVKPLWALVYSRKALIAGAVVAFLLDAFPKLAPAQDALQVVVVQAVGIILTGIGLAIGIAMEDAAAKTGTPRGG